MKRDVSFAPRRTTVSPILGGAFALIFPTVIGLIALSVGFREGGDMTDFAGSLVATVLFLIVTPTAWVLSFPFIDVTRFTVILFGMVTSAPLWWLAGVAIARGADTWIVWTRRYLVASIVWMITNIVVIAIIASLVS
ncbi:MAG: hypothetical protein M5U23_12470 [Acidimicrobiia bacterium]|nr:hypothetical protein [Acidimicrobiia bacterium]